MTTTTPHASLTSTRCSFARLVALHCRLSGHDPEPRDLDQWLASTCPMVSEDMDAALEIARELGRANPGGSYEVRPLAMFSPGGNVA